MMEVTLSTGVQPDAVGEMVIAAMEKSVCCTTKYMLVAPMLVMLPP
jgi:hypothetical protein